MASKVFEAKHQKTRRAVYVWQLPIRLFHWINALAIIVLFVTGIYIGKPILSPIGEATQNFIMGKMRFWHGVFAFIFIANMIFRLYWFYVGNEHSKLKFWRKDFWKDALDTFNYYTFRTTEHSIHLGHNALAQFMYLWFVWIAGAFMIITGAAMRGGIFEPLFWWVIPAFKGEYQVRNLHHLVAWGYAIFLLGHLYMVIRQDILDDDGTISSIINGYKFEISDDNTHK